MGLFDRIRKTSPGPEPESDAHDPRGPVADPAEDLPASGSRRLREDERSRVAAGLAALEAEGVDVDDLESLGAGLDRALAAWMTRQGADHDAIVERYAIGIGEHLTRRTDLAWAVVTDVFGTDLGVAAGDFMVVPHNLVAVRWMRRETGWVPKVAGHLLDLRSG